MFNVPLCYPGIVGVGDKILKSLPKPSLARVHILCPLLLAAERCEGSGGAWRGAAVAGGPGAVPAAARSARADAARERQLHAGGPSVPMARFGTIAFLALLFGREEKHIFFSGKSMWKSEENSEKIHGKDSILPESITRYGKTGLRKAGVWLRKS